MKSVYFFTSTKKSKLFSSSSLVGLIGAISCTGIMSSAQAGNVTLYGIVDVSVEALTNVGQKDANGLLLRDDYNRVVQSTKFSVQNNKRSTSRFGLRGVEDIGGGWSAIFTLETGFRPDTGELTNPSRLFNRSVYAGLEHKDYGRFRAGALYTPMVEHFIYFDPYTVPGNGIVSSHTARFADGVRVENAISYHHDNFANGFYVASVFSMGEQPDSFMKKSSASFGVGYKGQDFQIGGAFFGHRNNGAPPGNPRNLISENDTPRAYSIAGKYSFDRNWTAYAGYLHHYYSQAEQVNDFFWAGLKYDSDKWTYIGAVYHDTLRDASVTTKSGFRSGEGLTTYTRGRLATYSVSAEYKFSKRTSVYTQLDLTRARDALRFTPSSLTDEAATQTGINIGMRHRF